MFDITTCTMEELKAEGARIADEAMYVMDTMDLYLPTHPEFSALSKRLTGLKAQREALIIRSREIRAAAQH